MGQVRAFVGIALARDRIGKIVRKRASCYDCGQAGSLDFIRISTLSDREDLLSWFSYPAGGAGAASAPRRKVSPSQTGRFAPPS